MLFTVLDVAFSMKRYLKHARALDAGLYFFPEVEFLPLIKHLKAENNAASDKRSPALLLLSSACFYFPVGKRRLPASR